MTQEWLSSTTAQTRCTMNNSSENCKDPKTLLGTTMKRCRRSRGRWGQNSNIDNPIKRRRFLLRDLEHERPQPRKKLRGRKALLFLRPRQLNTNFVAQRLGRHTRRKTWVPICTIKGARERPCFVRNKIAKQTKQVSNVDYNTFTNHRISHNREASPTMIQYFNTTHNYSNGCSKRDATTRRT